AVLGVLASPAARALLRRVLSPGAAIILLIAVAASVGVALIQPKPPVGLPFWVFADVHYRVYSSIAADWTRRHPDHPVHVLQLTNPALERRMLSGFLAGTPVADIIAAERPVAAKAFVGPLEDVGFVDVTDRLRAEGLLENILPNSLTPWTTRGRIFGLPLDVHPVLLAYRSDLVEAAGIDVTQVETWEDYFRLLRPLQQDLDGDGRPDRWLLNLWDTSGDLVLMLLDQAGGGLFDARDHPQLNAPRNAEVLAQIVTWVAGPGRVCADVDLFSASGHRQRLDGVVIGTLMPDWMCGLWKQEIPGLAGKVSSCRSPRGIAAAGEPRSGAAARCSASASARAIPRAPGASRATSRCPPSSPPTCTGRPASSRRTARSGRSRSSTNPIRTSAGNRSGASSWAWPTTCRSAPRRRSPWRRSPTSAMPSSTCAGGPTPPAPTTGRPCAPRRSACSTRPSISSSARSGATPSSPTRHEAEPHLS
ncbi:MAG: extracellular solute-binding protein, partial [Bauldia sp.]